MGDRNAPNLYQCILGDGEEGKDEEKKNEGQFGRRGGSRRLTAYMIRWAREFSPMIKGTPSVPQSTIHSTINNALLSQLPS